MNLKVLLPTQILVDRKVEKIVAEAKNGSFCLLEHHIDFTTALVRGILSFVAEGGDERFLAVDEGLLVKCANDVYISVRDAIEGDDPDRLVAKLQEKYSLDQEERQKAETALARMESNFINNFLHLNKYNE